MGDTIIAMSMFNSLTQPVHITTQPNSWYSKWKSIFNIGDQITITVDDYNHLYQNPPHPRILESFKVFSRYIQTDSITLFNQQFPVGRRDKKCVAILINNGEHVKDSAFFNRIDTISRDEYPYVKFHSRSTYNTILDLVMSAGYDPLIIDSKDISIENKVFMLNELCNFVIGYEGGMCHVAHALKIPTIILPWRVVTDSVYLTDFLHIDKQTYLVRNVKELQEWTPNYLLNLVDGLYNEVGFNNQWMVESTFPDPKPFLDHYLPNSSEQFRQQHDWVIQYIDNPTLGGY